VWGNEPTLQSGLPFWELESQWISELSKSYCKNQNSLDWKFLYIIGKFLELRFRKWVRMSHWIFKTQVVTKKKVESKIANLIPDHQNSRISLIYSWKVACHISLERSRQGLQLCFKPHPNQRSIKKVMGHQSHGSLRTKWH
jgi:hypothetical protein